MADPQSLLRNDGGAAVQPVATRDADAAAPILGVLSAFLKRAWDPAADPITAGGITPRVSASFVRAAGAVGAYATGDVIGQSETAADVAALAFTAARKVSGDLTGARLVMKAGSGSIVLPTGLELLLFRAKPFADAAYPADNGPCVGAAGVLGDAAARNFIGRIRFSDFFQCSSTLAVASGPVVNRSLAPFNLAGLDSQTIYGVLTLPSGAAWNPGAVAYTFDVDLDVHQD